MPQTNGVHFPYTAAMTSLDRQYQQAEANLAKLAAAKLKQEREAAQRQLLEANSAKRVDDYLRQRIATSLLTGSPDAAAIDLMIQRSTDQPRAFIETVFDILVHPVSGLGRSGTEWIIGGESYRDLSDVKTAIERMTGTTFAGNTSWLTGLLPHVLRLDSTTADWDAASRRRVAIEEALSATDGYPADLTASDLALLHRTFGTGDMFQQNTEV